MLSTSSKTNVLFDDNNTCLRKGLPEELCCEAVICTRDNSVHDQQACAALPAEVYFFEEDPIGRETYK